MIRINNSGDDAERYTFRVTVRSIQDDPGRNEQSTILTRGDPNANRRTRAAMYFFFRANVLGRGGFYHFSDTRLLLYIYKLLHGK